MKPQHVTNPGILLFHIPLRKCSQQVLLSWLLEKPTGMACFLVMSTAKQEHRILTALVHDHFDTQTHKHYLQRSAAVLSMQAGQPSDSETHGTYTYTHMQISPIKKTDVAQQIQL